MLQKVAKSVIICLIKMRIPLRHLVTLHQNQFVNYFTVHLRQSCRYNNLKNLHSKKNNFNFSGQTVYITSVENANEVSENLRHSNNTAFGFDIEWPPQKKKGVVTKTALLQICPHSSIVYLFHLAAMTEFPQKLKDLLTDEKIIKAGIGINNDFKKLEQDFSFHITQGVVDLSDLAIDKGFLNQHSWGLQGLVEKVLNQVMGKNQKITQSNWNQMPLTEEQLHYAALDAYACYILYKKLLSL